LSFPNRETEAHSTPEKAISGSAQSLDLQQFGKLMRDLKPYIELWKETRTRKAADQN
jgi:3-deoxy-D-arabino-heptulosonate 7-phosphate (DAHP) synthase